MSCRCLVHRADACVADRYVDAHWVRDESVGRSNDQVAPTCARVSPRGVDPIRCDVCGGDVAGVEREVVRSVGGASRHVDEHTAGRSDEVCPG